MQTQQPTTYLHSITIRDTVILIHSDKEPSEEQILNDTDGKMYYMDGNKRIPLPPEFQPRLIVR